MVPRKPQGRAELILIMLVAAILVGGVFLFLGEKENPIQNQFVEPTPPPTCARAGETRSCTIEGHSGLQTRTCENGEWTPWTRCRPRTQNETCDGRDNDLDGLIDEDLGQTTCGLGICETMIDNCVAGSPQICIPGEPQSETQKKCDDDLDNDCDGLIDSQDSDCERCARNGETRPCGTGLPGRCANGNQTCQVGHWSDCAPTVTMEICDSLDNDCDGAIDENCTCTNGATRPCLKQSGICKGRNEVCANSKWVGCNYSAIQGYQANETLCDLLDNDCDGVVDEDCPCENGQTRHCTKQKGVCKDFNETCINEVWVGCNYNSLPGYQWKETSCDGRDNDCDGDIDEDCRRVFPAIRGLWFGWKDTDQMRDTAVSNGINALITSYGAFTNFNDGDTEEIDLIKDVARYAKKKNVMFIPVLKFVNPYQYSKVSKERGLIYKNGVMKDSNMTPPLSEEFWDDMTKKIKMIAQLPIENSNYRVDGIFLDFELYDHYDETLYYFTYNGSYDTSTFDEFVSTKNLAPPDPPTSPNRRFERYDWLVENGLSHQYTSFIRDKAASLAEEMKTEITSLNPNFFIGSYQSPGWRPTYSSPPNLRYNWPMYFDFFKGWSRISPHVLFATETYSGGERNLPAELKPTDKGYFRLERLDMPGESVNIYYVAGMLLRQYPLQILPQIHSIAAKTNGFWLFSGTNLYTACDKLLNEYYRLPTNCLNDQRDPGCCINNHELSQGDWLTECCPRYQEAVQDYWDIIAQRSGRADNICGDEICSQGETPQNCFGDCKGSCGDGFCHSRFETHFDCPSDCKDAYYIVDQQNPSCSKNGVEPNAGTTGKPFCTLNLAIVKVKPGDTVYLRDGLQSFGGYQPVETAGTADEYITFRDYPGEEPVIESGTLFDGDWDLVETGSGYKIFEADKNLGTNPLLYPSRVFYENDNPMTEVFSMEDLRNALNVQYTTDPFDAYYIDCGTGDFYMRLADSSKQPSKTNIFFVGYNRWKLKRSYIRLIGLTMQHASDGVKMETPTDNVLIQHVELYDCTIRSVIMAIADVSTRDPNQDNGFIFQSNKIQNTGSEAFVEIVSEPNYGLSGPLRCVAEDSGKTKFTFVNGDAQTISEKTVDGLPSQTYKYVNNRWEHVVYGTATGIIFAGNDVDSGGTKTAIGATAHSKYFNNRIKGDIIGGGYDVPGENLEIFNNVIEDPTGWALHLSTAVKSAKIYNNLLIGNRVDYGYSMVYFGIFTTIFNPDIEFKNNIIVELGQPYYCIMIDKNDDPSKLDFNNNIYVRCDRWWFRDSRGVTKAFDSNNPAKNLEDWQDFMSPHESNSFLASESELFRNFGNGDYRLKSGSLAIDAGVSVDLATRDINGKQRDDKPDIGPYEY